MLPDKYCIKIARLLFPWTFEDSHNALSSNRYLIKGINEIIVRRYAPQKKHSSDHFFVELHFSEFYQLEHHEWKLWRPSTKPIVTTDEIILVRRNDVNKPVEHVIWNLKHFFYANTLLVKTFSSFDGHRQHLKDEFARENAKLLFEDELV